MINNDFWQERTLLLIREDNLAILKNAHVFVAGLGGVGAYAAEMLCRAGIGRMTIADGDQINPSNLNRQLLALNSTQGKRKALLMRQRLLDINPDLELTVIDEYLLEERLSELMQTPFDYIVDAIDTLSPKTTLIHQALKNDIPLVSSMGAGGKMDPGQVLVADFFETYNCRLASTLRKRLRKFDLQNHFKAVFSTEITDDISVCAVENEPNKKSTVGTISFMPAIFGCVCSSVVVRDLLKITYPLARRPHRRSRNAIDAEATFLEP